MLMTPQNHKTRQDHELKLTLMQSN